MSGGGGKSASIFIFILPLLICTPAVPLELLSAPFNLLNSDPPAASTTRRRQPHKPNFHFPTCTQQEPSCAPQRSRSCMSWAPRQPAYKPRPPLSIASRSLRLIPAKLSARRRPAQGLGPDEHRPSIRARLRRATQPLQLSLEKRLERLPGRRSPSRSRLEHRNHPCLRPRVAARLAFHAVGRRPPDAFWLFRRGGCRLSSHGSCLDSRSNGNLADRAVGRILRRSSDSPPVLSPAPTLVSAKSAVEAVLRCVTGHKWQLS